MVRLDIPIKLINTNAGLAFPQSISLGKFGMAKIFLESRKYIRLISKYKTKTTLNEFSSSFGKYSTRRISWDILKPFSYCY